MAILLAGCRNGSTPTPDAAVIVRPPDAALPSDAIPTPLAVDFTASACPLFEEGPRCTGHAPLTLEFVPLATASVTKFLWTFGDGTAKSSARVPVHTYAFPGTYDVLLVGSGVAGSAQQFRPGFVVVTANQVGEPCDVDQQCDTRLRCICGSEAKCTAAFARGLCAMSCGAAECRTGETCADLSLAAASAPRQPWQEALCLRACQTDAECGPGLLCRDLPATTPPGTWTRGCFPGAPEAPGRSCRSASGQLRNDACITGQCVDLGANGLCSLDCSKSPCPPGTTCAELTDGRRVCLQRCSPEVTCDRDPLLACTAPNQGPLGFTVMGGPPGATYCAPKICSNHEDCGPAGTCHDDVNGAHCVRKQ
jgi:PKD repeat protein